MLFLRWMLLVGEHLIMGLKRLVSTLKVVWGRAWSASVLMGVWMDEEAASSPWGSFCTLGSLPSPAFCTSSFSSDCWGVDGLCGQSEESHLQRLLWPPGGSVLKVLLFTGGECSFLVASELGHPSLCMVARGPVLGPPGRASKSLPDCVR